MDKKLFGTDGIRGASNTYPIIPEVIVKIGKAVGLILKKRTGKKHPKVILGKDTRICSYVIETALTSGLCSVGVDVKLIGPLPTPGIAFLVRSMIADLGIVLTASHNPFSDNGIKIFSEKGVKIAVDFEREVEERVFNDDISSTEIKGELIGKAERIENAMGRFIEFLKFSVNQSFSGLSLAIDCANGAAYKIAPTLFKELGAETFVINNTPNGLNINDNCGALHTEGLKKLVQEKSCDLGVAFDGDADRAIFVNSRGQVIDGDHILYLIARNLCEEGKLKNKTAVVTSYSNLAIDSLLAEQGIKTMRVENGDKYVIEGMLANDLSFGGEKSGHIIIGESNSTGDGLLSALFIAKLLLKNKDVLDDLDNKLPLFPQVLKNISVNKKLPLEQIREYEDLITSIERRLGSKGRVFVRYSGTESICRIMIEGEVLTDIEQYSEDIASLLSAKLN